MNNTERFMRLFRGYEKRHGRYTVEKQEDSGKYTGKAHTVDQPPEIADFEAHLKGERGIGIIPLTSDNRCYFAAIDIDEYPVDHLKIAWAVKDMPLFVTRSKSNGAHVWLFIPDGASAEVVVRYMKKVAGELGYAGCEIFPKQTQRASVHDVGNWINLPFFGDSRKSVVIEDGNKKVTAEYEITEWLDFVYANISEVTEAELDDRAPRVTGTRSRKGTKEDYTDGPPCLERVKQHGMGENTGRNNVIWMVTNYLSRKYSSPDEIETRVMDFNHKVFDPPLPTTEVRTTMKSVLSKGEQGFMCNREPMAGYCSRSDCLRRAFGVGSRSTDLPFEIGGFSKLLTQPPMYAFNADGKRIVLPNVRALSNQKEFRNYLIDAISIVMPLMAQPKYDELIQQWLSTCEDVEMAPDADFRQVWADMLSEWVQENTHDDRARISMGHAYQDYEAGLVWFRLQDFKAFLRRNRINYNDSQLQLYLTEQMGVKYHKKGTTVGKKSDRLYSVPIENLDLPEPSKPTQEGDVL